MSRLSAARMNPPSKGITAKTGFKGFRKNQPKYNAPIALHGVCRDALNSAIKAGEGGIADHISETPHRQLYSALSKPALIRLMHNLLKGARIPAQKKYWPEVIANLALAH